MRVGYGVGSGEIVTMMERARLSRNLGVIERTGHQALRDHQDHVRKAARMMSTDAAG
jgi:histidinol-phosphate/aromatic aminotransferase/cobyric acid decarboxylase-like protein